MYLLLNYFYFAEKPGDGMDADGTGPSLSVPLSGPASDELN